MSKNFDDKEMTTFAYKYKIIEVNDKATCRRPLEVRIRTSKCKKERRMQ